MEPGGSYARTLFPTGPSAPSEQALDPATLDALRAALASQSQASSAQALRTIPPEAEREAKWNLLQYRTPEEETMMGEQVGTGLAGMGAAGGAGVAGMAGGRWGARPSPEQAAVQATLKPKWRLQSGQDRASIPKAPDFDEQTVKRYFEKGAKDPRNVNWYTEGQQAGQWLAGEDEPLLRYFGSVFSQRKGPVPETNLAMKAFRAWKERGVEGVRQMVGPSIHQRGELVRGALAWENNPRTDLAKQMTSGSMKRRDYYGARGETDVSVIDTHAGNVATRGQFKPSDPLDYYGVQHGYHDLADKAGVPRRGYQAAVWVPWREEQAALRGVPAGDPSPAARILLQQAERNPDWQALVRAGKVPTPPSDWSKKLLYGLLGPSLAASVFGPQEEAP